MNILIPDSWLREYLETDAAPNDVQKYLSLCGPSVERMQKKDGDYIYDIEVTTNRVDCMSVLGIAREAAAILPQFNFKAALKPLITQKLKTGPIPGFSIKNDPKLCKRILALKISGVKIEPGPKWLSDRLNLAGLRSINNLVDLTNYVMLETGHPAHVFDFNRLNTQMLNLRLAKKGEEIITLDNRTHVLAGGEVIIDDNHGRIIDLPSVMGTENSVVNENTHIALFFIDNVDKSFVRYASMTHAIRTPAAALLEKGVDPNIGLTAISRIAELLKSILPEVKISDLLDIYPEKTPVSTVSVSYSKINEYIGIDIPPDMVKNILSRLEFKILSGKTGITVTPPVFRNEDIKIPEDVIEEISRIYGYHNIPPIQLSGILPAKLIDRTFDWELKIKTSLKYLGFTETYTYSLVSEGEGLKLSNPLSSEMTHLRTSLFPSHKQIISENTGRGAELKFFEVADVYLPKKNNLPEEESRLIISTDTTDLYRFKGRLEAFISDIGVQNIHPDIQSQHNILFWEISMNNLIKNIRTAKHYLPISKFPAIIEDFNINLTSSYSALETKIKKLSPLIKSIELIDKYESKLTLRITFHTSEKQLSSDDIVPIRDQISKLSSVTS